MNKLIVLVTRKGRIRIAKSVAKLVAAKGMSIVTAESLSDAIIRHKQVGDNIGIIFAPAEQVTEQSRRIATGRMIFLVSIHEGDTEVNEGIYAATWESLDGDIIEFCHLIEEAVEGMRNESWEELWRHIAVTRACVKKMDADSTALLFTGMLAAMANEDEDEPEELQE